MWQGPSRHAVDAQLIAEPPEPTTGGKVSRMQPGRRRLRVRTIRLFHVVNPKSSGCT
jgi:hypothetical protein